MFITGGLLVVGTRKVAETGGGGDRDLGGAELGVVKEEGCLCSAVKAVSSSLSNKVGHMGAYVSFSKVTVALCGLSGASEVGVTEREVILPL